MGITGKYWEDKELGEDGYGSQVRTKMATAASESACGHFGNGLYGAIKWDSKTESLRAARPLRAT